MAEEEVAKTNVRIERLIESGVLDNLHYVAPNLNSPTPSSPILSPIIQGHYLETNVEEPDNVEMDPTIDGGDIWNKYPHLSSLNESTLDILCKMPNR